MIFVPGLFEVASLESEGKVPACPTDSTQIIQEACIDLSTLRKTPQDHWEESAMTTQDVAVKVAKSLLDANKATFDLDLKDEGIAALLADAFADLGCEVKRRPFGSSLLVMIDKESTSQVR